MFGFMKKGLAKTLNTIKESLPAGQKIDKETLEDVLLEADIPYEIVEEIIFYLPPDEIVKRDDVKFVMENYFLEVDRTEKNSDDLHVELIIGVNGAGKTTTIAKLANMHKKNGKKVMLGAGDTFRAAAIEQLKRWSEKIDVPIVLTQQGHDSSAVAFDTISSASSKGFDNVIIDTAGRLHNHTNLSNELQKIVRICGKAKSSAPHSITLVLDGTQGSSAIHQAKSFNEIVGVNKIIITKLDGSAKGGSLFGVARELKLPIDYIGVGEGVDDLIPFDSDEFIETILDGIFAA